MTDAQSSSVAVPHVLTIIGSLRRASFNARLMDLATVAGAEVAAFEAYTGLQTVPPFNQDDEDDPGPAVEDVRARIAAADGVLIATPEYNGSLPGQFKNALDWASRPFATNVLRDKPVAAMGASPGGGGARRSLATLRLAMERTGAVMIEEHVTVPHAHENLDDPALPGRLKSVVEALVARIAAS